MPSLSQLPDNLKAKKLIKALEKLGFIISAKGGKGDHVKVTCIKTQKAVIIPDCRLRKDVLCYILKELEKCSGVTWDDIKDKL